MHITQMQQNKGVMSLLRKSQNILLCLIFFFLKAANYRTALSPNCIFIKWIYIEDDPLSPS